MTLCVKSCFYVYMCQHDFMYLHVLFMSFMYCKLACVCSVIRVSLRFILLFASNCDVLYVYLRVFRICTCLKCFKPKSFNIFSKILYLKSLHGLAVHAVNTEHTVYTFYTLELVVQYTHCDITQCTL